MKHVRQKLCFCDGMTLVELMVAVGITAIMMTLSISIFMSQHKSYVNIQDANQAQETMPAAMEILKRDLMEAGWSVTPKMAFYVEDGGATSSDKIYMNDISIIDILPRLPDNRSDLRIMVDRRRRACPGCRSFPSGWAGPDDSMTFASEDELDINLLDTKSSDNGTPDFNDEGMYVITDTDNVTHKIAKISSISGGTITFDRDVDGTFIAPAIYYEVDNDNSTLRRSDRNTGGAQPLAENIADLQVAYCVAASPDGCSDPSVNWHCNGIGSCPTDSFDPTKIQMVRLTLVIRNAHRDKSLENNPKYCRPARENREATDTSDAVLKEKECGYKYRTYTTQFVPRNAR